MMNIYLKTTIKELKKDQIFYFNDKMYVVKHRFSDWKRNGEPYLKAINQSSKEETLFYSDDLEVTI